MTDQDKILFQIPFFFRFIWVQMIEPSLPALLGSSEVLSIWTDVQLFSQFAPLILPFFGSELSGKLPDKGRKYFVFMLWPFLGWSWFFIEADGLVLEEDVLFVGEDRTEVFPIFMTLNRKREYKLVDTHFVNMEIDG